MSYEKPFAGLKVLDMSQGYAGPYCAGLLAQYGADVTKVEPPEGDWSRGLGRVYGDQTTISLAANRGKKSIVLDLKSAGGLAVAHDLAARCDVFMEGFRPGVCARFGLAYDDLRQVNPGVIYMAISGFGHDGPYAREASTDTVAQAFSGLMSINRGNDGVPHRVGHFIVDCVTALYAYQALSTALYARRDEPAGRFIDCSLMQAAAAVQTSKIADFHLEDGKPVANNAPAGSYNTQNGFIAITLVKEEQFRQMCQALGQPALADDPRYLKFANRAENMDSLGPVIQEILLQRTALDWAAHFQAAGVLAHPVADYGDWMADPHVVATQAFQMIAQQGVGPMPVAQIPGAAAIDPDDPSQQVPFLGEHSWQVLGDLGYDEEKISGLVAEGAVRLGSLKE
ncbi:MAG: CoA transferase [Alphaproteobacteria bacterium]|nr:CoA transferase [Alphaproteobacteria bacterium]